VTEDEIRELAYQLWQEDGCPEGRAEEHWAKARALLSRSERKSEQEPGASIDEQIEDSFPASDAPSYNAGGRVGVPRQKKSGRT